MEAIKIYGVDCYYLPRTVENRDNIFREAEYSSFNTAFLLEMYVKNVDGFEGDGEFLSKFGLEVRDQITFTVSQRAFNEEIQTYNAEERPMEGALIFFPLNGNVYQIKYVAKKNIFYQLGALQTYDITCELFEYSNEIFNTGIAYIDEKYNSFSTLVENYALIADDGSYLVSEAGEILVIENTDIEDFDNQAMNDEFEKEGLEFIDFTEIDPFSEGGRI